MKILVTGANGFLGSALSKELVEAGHSVKVLLKDNSSRGLLNGLEIETVRGDIRSPEVVSIAAEGIDVVYHLASIYGFCPWWDKKADTLYDVNLEGTKNILYASLKNKVKRFIFTSSISAIGREKGNKPSDENTVYNLGKRTSHYARSKVLSEREILSYAKRGLNCLILNPAIIIGRGDYKPTPSGDMIIKFLNGKYPFYFGARMSFADLDSVVGAHISALTKGRPGQRYILANEKSHSLEGFFKLLEELSGVSAPKKKILYPLLIRLVYIDELLSHFIFKRKPLMPSEGVRFCRRSLEVDSSKAKKELDYKDLPLKDSLIKAINWYKENGYIKNA